jgi:MOSC domain-containing protein YiiM
MLEIPEAECVAGRGLRGDRYFDHKEDYKGQITFFSLDVFDQLCGTLQVEGADPSLVRRNVFVRGIDLNTLIGKDFEVQGIRFHGTEESRPCHWMNRAIGAGAQEFLRGRGGLRARILNDGILRSVSRPAAIIE